MKLKKILASILVCAMVVYSPLVAAEASTIDEYTATFGDVVARAKSEIDKTSASCLTSISTTGMTYITGTYYYVNTSTMETGSKTSGNGGLAASSVSFSAPTKCRSVKVSGNHRVTFGAQSWSASTEAIY